MSDYTRVLYSTLFELSRTYQNKQASHGSRLYERIMRTLDKSPRFLHAPPAIACCCFDATYSKIACNKIFITPYVIHCKDILDAFRAVDRGTCRYGLIPIDNYFGGTAPIVYDLLLQYKFYIIGGANIRTDHNLYAKPGTDPSTIELIFGHQRALSECSEFLTAMDSAMLESTGTSMQAAYAVASSPHQNVAAICSKTCGQHFGLECLYANIYDPKNPRNKYLCFSKKFEIFPGARKSFFMFIINNEPGSLYRIISRLNVLGLNITMLKPRVVPENINRIQVYLEVERSIFDDAFRQFVESLDELCLEYKYLGSYSEKFT